VFGPIVSGRPLSHEEAKKWNRSHPDAQVAIPPKDNTIPFSWWNPGSWLAPHPAVTPPAGSPGNSAPSGNVIHASYMTYGSPLEANPYGPPPQWGYGRTSSAMLPNVTALPPNSNTIPANFIVPKNLGASDNEYFAHDFFRSQGWTEAQVAGILAYQKSESGYKPNAFNPAGGNYGAQGISQWRGARVEQFQNLFGHSIMQSTLAEQLAFTQWELTHTEKSAGDRLRALGKTPGESVDIMTQYYGRGPAPLRQRENLADMYAHIYSKPSPSVTVHNATGGNAVVTASQLAAA
jgi:hypothetical protein